jgi:hypothetical protein
MNRLSSVLAAYVALSALTGCTLHHSKQALWVPAQPPPARDSRFVTEEDSGLSLLGIFVFSEPDHYAVLVERARSNYRCSALHHIQLDFFTDHWLIVAFPISRITLVCAPETPVTVSTNGR